MQNLNFGLCQMDQELLAKLASSHVDVAVTKGSSTNHFVMWKIKNDVVFILTLSRQERMSGLAAVGASALKLYHILNLLI